MRRTLDPCQQGDGGVTLPHEVSSVRGALLRYFAGPRDTLHYGVCESYRPLWAARRPMLVLYFAANSGRSGVRSYLAAN